jgi:hypothetical protein
MERRQADRRTGGPSMLYSKPEIECGVARTARRPAGAVMGWEGVRRGGVVGWSGPARGGAGR